MTEKRERQSRDNPTLVAKIPADLASSKPSRPETRIEGCWEFLPYVEVILTALFRGLNDSDESVRQKAANGMLLAFPGIEAELSLHLLEIESNDSKVRLAATERVITILANFLSTLSGTKPDELSISLRQPVPVTEDLMEHAGRWVAWTRNRQQIVAVADSFADAMTRALAAGEPDPYVKKAPGVSLKPGLKAFAILEDESPDIIDDVRKVFPDADVWLDAPNDSLGGEKPRDLLKTERERELRYLLRGIEDGITT